MLDKIKSINIKILPNLINKKVPEPIVLIHIGKCGGSTVKKELKENKIKFIEKHVCNVNYFDKNHYVILVRNPISRFVSAFNWRYRLVVDKGVQSNRFKNERTLLKKYQNINTLAENIYNHDFSKDSYIHHITEDINFHIGGFLNDCDKKNIFAVLATETLKSDLKKYFNIKLRSHEKDNSKKYSTSLSNLAYKNLKRYLQKDYECINKLYQLDLISKEKYNILSK